MYRKEKTRGLCPRALQAFIGNEQKTFSGIALLQLNLLKQLQKIYHPE